MAFVCEIETDLIFVWGSKLTSFMCAVRKLLGFNLCGWSKLTWFLYAGSKSLGYSVGIEIYLVLVWVVEIYLILVWGMDLDLISM